MKTLVHVCATSVAVAASLSSASAANIISFNTVGSATGGMGASETAGAPGAVGKNWNNMFSVQNTAGGAISGSIGAGFILDDNGVTLSTTAISWSGTGAASRGGSGTNDQKMFQSEWDLFDSSNDISTSDMTITLTDVPYSTYDVYFYVQDAENSAIRGGNITANGITKSITMFNTTGDNPAGANGYTEADSAFTWNETNTEVGSFLRIGNVTGDTLTLDLSSQNPSTSRLRFSGFQVVQVPEASHAALVLFGFGGAAFLRRRPHA